MNEQKTHPSEGSTKIGSFDEFREFIHLEGLDEPAEVLFLRFLEDLYRVSSSVWTPSSCHACEFLEERAKDLLAQPQYAGIKIEPKSFEGDGHFWLEAIVPGHVHTLVIDPFGVPTPMQDYHTKPRTITPFFGNPGFARENVKKVYAEGKRLINDVYHIFRP